MTDIENCFPFSNVCLLIDPDIYKTHVCIYTQLHGQFTLTEKDIALSTCSIFYILHLIHTRFV